MLAIAIDQLSIDKSNGTPDDEELIVVQLSDNVCSDQPNGSADHQFNSCSTSTNAPVSSNQPHSDNQLLIHHQDNNHHDMNHQDNNHLDMNHQSQTSHLSSDQSSEDEQQSTKSSKQQLFINTNLSSVVTNTNGLHQLNAPNGLANQPPAQQSPSATSSTASSLSLPVDMDSIDDGIHGLNSVTEPKQTSRDYRTHEEFVYAMKEDLAEWLNGIYDLQLNVHNFMDQVGTGVIICK